MMTPIKASDLVKQMQWRYATKTFDADKIIPDDIWKALEATLVLTPSSFGLQPWRFVVVTSRTMKEKLRAHSWKQSQVTDCSHYVVFCALKQFAEADIDRYLARTMEIHGVTLESLKGYRNVMANHLIKAGQGNLEWAARQTYIALGNFMTAAALLQIDTCPMEGFQPDKYDEVLGLSARGLTAVVCCAAGYRSSIDKYAAMPKVRFPASEMVENIQ